MGGNTNLYSIASSFSETLPTIVLNSNQSLMKYKKYFGTSFVLFPKTVANI